jgi:hypothetical protein
MFAALNPFISQYRTKCSLQIKHDPSQTYEYEK